ncbi:hypothetical protein PG985_005280 [Apiospora marii]|uniref:Uncharacterized protein n=1 Tax=Apiospora marii TaxID=335849 RepID=A0ABR1SDC4_9PEZI
MNLVQLATDPDVVDDGLLSNGFRALSRPVVQGGREAGDQAGEEGQLHGRLQNPHNHGHLLSWVLASQAEVDGRNWTHFIGDIEELVALVLVECVNDHTQNIGVVTKDVGAPDESNSRLSEVSCITLERMSGVDQKIHLLLFVFQIACS